MGKISAPLKSSLDSLCSRANVKPWSAAGAQASGASRAAK